MDREITSVIDDLIASIIYAEIGRLINLQNNRITTLLFEFVPNGGNATLPLNRFPPTAFRFSQLQQKTAQFLCNF
jgi:hypothetical protein